MHEVSPGTFKSRSRGGQCNINHSRRNQRIRIDRTIVSKCKMKSMESTCRWHHFYRAYYAMKLKKYSQGKMRQNEWSEAKHVC